MAITHKGLVAMLTTARPSLSDEYALQTIDMFPYWENYIGVPITQAMVDKGYDRYQYNGELYKIVQPHTPQTDWTPDTQKALWTKVSLEEWPEWVPPTGAQDAYDTGAKVTYKGEKYISQIDGNTTEPVTDVRWWIEA